MSVAFEHQTYAQRVVFRSGGAGEVLAQEVERLGARRVLLVVAEAEAALAASLTGGVPVAATFSAIRPHVPVEVAVAAREAAAAADADALVCVGGGSTTGTAKAVALTTGLPIVAVPTTYAGSEATPVWGLTEAGRKTTGTDERVLPRAVVYDAELVVGLPADLSVASGLNAMAHCVDSLWAPRTNPLLAVTAGEGIAALARSLPAVRADGGDLDARARSLYGAYLAATTFAGAGSGLHHKVCHVLGGRWDLPHAQTHAVVLPHVLAFNAPAAPAAVGVVARALDHPDGVAALVELYAALGAPRSLRELGLPEQGLEEAADLVVAAAPASNPREVDREGVRALLERAWSGQPPLVEPHEPVADGSKETR